MNLASPDNKIRIPSRKILQQACVAAADVGARLWDVIAGDPRLGFCLDTCHTHAAGEELVTAVERITAITGRIDLVHYNGSRDAAGTGRDRHQNFATSGTDNQIAAEALVEIVRSAAAPVICETPAAGVADDIALLRDAVG